MTTGQPAIARVTREFAASPERVFDAWLDPEKVKIWWRATAAAAGRGATETIENVTIDAQVGGSFSILVRRVGKLLAAVQLSHREIADEIGLSKSAVQHALRVLHRRNLVKSKRRHQTDTPTHSVLRPWIR